MQWWDNDSSIRPEWLPSDVSYPISVEGHALSEVLLHPFLFGDLLLKVCKSLAYRLKSIAIHARVKESAKSWASFLRDQFRNGSKLLHSFVNRDNSLPPVQLFSGKSTQFDPQVAVDDKAVKWTKQWQAPECIEHGEQVFNDIRNKCA